MKKMIFAISLAFFAAVSCSKINELDSRVKDLENRMNDVEQALLMINSNISGLQDIVNAINANDFIKEIKDIKDASGSVIGYELVFTKKGSVKIYHGQDGATGATGATGAQGPKGDTPKIGIAQYSDGLYYWTLDGAWLKSSDGKMVLAVGRDGKDGENGSTGNPGAPGTDGKDGVTPRLKIEQGSWWIMYDEQQGWTQLGVATQVTSSDFFTSIQQDGDELVLNLADGTSYRVPIGSSLSIAYNTGKNVITKPGATCTVHYVINASAGSADIEVLGSGDLKVKIANQQGLEGDIEVVLGSELSEYSKVVVIVTDGHRIITDRLTFEEEGLEVSDNTNKTMAAAGGSLELEFLTNTDASVIVPEDAQSWISASEVVTKALVPHATTLTISQNTGVARSAVVSIKSKSGLLRLDYTIYQEGVISQFSFTHGHTSFPGSNFPTVEGTQSEGKVDWGDAVATAWGTYAHDYTDGGKSHTVTVTMPTITQVSFATLDGITAIDLSKM